MTTDGDVEPAAPAAARRTPGTDLGSLHDLWAVLVRRKLVVAAVFLVTTTTVVLGAMMLPPSYTAQAALMIKHGREFIYRDEVGDSADRSIFSLQEMVNSEVEVLGSRDLAEQVIREIGVERIYPEMIEKLEPGADPERLIPAAVLRLQESTTPMGIPESSIIRITHVNRDRQVAADVLNCLVKHFTAKHVELFGDPNRGFLTQQLDGYGAALAESEDTLEQFRQKHGLINPAEQKSLLLSRRMELEAELQTASFRMAELAQTMQLLQGTTSSQPAPDPPPPVTEGRDSLVSRRAEVASALQETELRLAELRRQLVVVRGREPDATAPVGPQPGMERFRSLDEAFVRLLDLQLREKDLQGKFNETSRQVTAVREEIALVESFLQERGAYVQEVIEAAIQDELEALLARRATAQLQLATIDVAIRDVDMRLVLDELAPLEARSSRIREEMARVAEQLGALEKLEKELRQLERRRMLDESNYQAFLAKAEEARMLDELARRMAANISVVERASAPIEPSSLSTKMRVLIGAFVGIFAGLAAAVFLELISQS